MTDWQSVLTGAIDRLRRSDPGALRFLEEQAGRPDAPPPIFLLLADARRMAGDEGGCEAALDEALKRDGRFLQALLAKGELVARRGDDRAAVSYLTLALSQTPADPPPALVERLRHAEGLVAAAQARFAGHLDDRLTAAGLGADRPSRFEEAVAILKGQASPQLQQPTSFFYPGLPQTAFYNSAEFPWISELESAASAMRAEVEALLGGESFAPYVQGDPTRANRGHALLNDPRWSAFYLWQNGAVVAENAARCPVTMRALEAAPMPMIPGRAPNVLFSQLKPRTHIPPHWGMLNTRLICHIPLIVPDGCRLRVGNHERRVEAGKALLFDDSILHEAWNDSDETRVILLLEVWNPSLDAAEREALTAMYGAIGLYGEG
ncbi:aspartyl/asparaginyl beta-hydroxylase domain-containing protein [Sphingomonas humi]|uniref:Aspartyl/asparaginy/proline hydroxylase domain-containing protein n=1 Tax=Sphingomonas humi TaxID=335630 RepID=A0ABP7RIP3_9SPHN